MQNLETQGCFVRSSARVLIAAALVAPLGAQATELVSVSSSRVLGNGNSLLSSICANGRYVAFESQATNLVGADTNGRQDIFVRDRVSGTTERVSLDSSGAQASLGHSYMPSISSNGRYVAFASNALNLVLGDTNGDMDIFVRDRQSGTTERVSLDSSEVQANDFSSGPSISADGRYVAFRSLATNLVTGDTNGSYDIFVRDRQSGTTERVSVDSSGAQGDADSFYLAISADGRFVVFASEATNLVGGDTNGFEDVFVRDRQSGTTERVSLDSSEAEVDDESNLPSISADGRYVAFRSLATNLVTGDTNALEDVFVRDRQNGTTEIVSIDSGGAQGDGGSNLPSISADGRYVAFLSYAANLVGGDTNGFTDSFVRDRQSGTTERVSIHSSGAEGNNPCSSSSISGDGRYVAFWSNATNLVDGDTNGDYDVFVRIRDALSFTSLCHPGTDGVIGCPCGQPANPTGGCANFGAGATSGAVLSATGVASVSADTVTLVTSNHRSPVAGVLNVFFSFRPGTVTRGTASGAGVRCTSGGDLKRLYTMQVFGGSGSKPEMGDASVSVRSAAFPGHAIVPAETRCYFNVYRDGQASGPCGSTSVSTNLTNMGSITWSP